jgi:hypothetical protein
LEANSEVDSPAIQELKRSILHALAELEIAKAERNAA